MPVQNQLNHHHHLLQPHQLYPYPEEDHDQHAGYTDNSLVIEDDHNPADRTINYSNKLVAGEFIASRRSSHRVVAGSSPSSEPRLEPGNCSYYRQCHGNDELNQQTISLRKSRLETGKDALSELIITHSMRDDFSNDNPSSPLSLTSPLADTIRR